MSEVPLLVTTAICAPALRPYSAWYIPVRIRNSCVESMLTVTFCDPFDPVSILPIPLIVSMFADLEIGRVDNPWGELRHIQRIASVDLKIFDLLADDRVGTLGALSLQDRS